MEAASGCACLRWYGTELLAGNTTGAAAAAALASDQCLLRQVADLAISLLELRNHAEKIPDLQISWPALLFDTTEPCLGIEGDVCFAD